MGGRTWAWAAAVVVATGCGSAGSGAPARGATGGVSLSPSSDAGSGTVDDGGVGAGSNDGGNSGGPGTSSGDGGAPDGGGLADGGTASCSAPAPVRVANSGGGSPGGCSALVPPDPLPPSRTLAGRPDTDGYGVWNPGWLGFDDRGYIGYANLVETDPNSGLVISGAELRILDPDGGVVGLQRFANVADGLSPFAQADGFAIVVRDEASISTIVTVDDSGAFRSGAVGRVHNMDTIPTGGTVAVAGGVTFLADGGSTEEPQVVTRRDAQLNVLWTWPLESRATGFDAVRVFATATDHVLVVVDHGTGPMTGTEKAYWLDEGGHLVRSLDEPHVGSWGVAKLVDGALAFASGDRDHPYEHPWATYVPDLRDPEAVPCWLAQRGNTDIVPVRGGHGYAVLSRVGLNDPDSPATFEIVTRNGESCGTFTPPCTSKGGQACSGEFRVGRDGTLWTSYPEGVPQRPTLDFWPRLLQ